ncbi:ABC transporter ATP-binding protein [Alteriqipengyuania flavescens]|uniref:ATP-binding cassette domain-containing protein n=1 Tax=Alteriqipengyuania flavescens TaxID=3053610 RepID=UPI0025B5AB33|nr:ABC transporter ATP-binding protein [Alteriqipengyuania flavescens]WJY19694.1 ABC transporter ATP-binding protein [Alteriqipengyuania flavescens]WJY25634.1 ABC transporter ATP-binding protein [Alteriqipengyuania flavescens]
MDSAIRDHLPACKALVLAVLTVAGAGLEALGAIALVPLFARLGGNAGRGADGGRLLEWAAALSLPSVLGLFVALVALRAAAAHLRHVVALDIEIAVVDGLRLRAFRSLLAADWRALSASRQSEHRALLISGIARVGHAVQEGGSALAAATTLAALSVAALLLSPVAAVTGISVGAGAMLLLLPLQRRARHLGLQTGAAYDAIYERLETSLDGLRLVKSFGREDAAATGLANELAQLRKTERAYLSGTAWARTALQLGGAIILGGVVWFAADTQGLALAIVLPLAAILLRSVPLLGALVESLQRWNNAVPAIGAVEDLLARMDAAAENADADNVAPPLTRALALDGVSVTYEGSRPALSGISLTIAAGEMVAVSGPSGAGKSTLADVLGGLVAPDEGALLVDGTPLPSSARAAWRRRVAYVQQEPVLFPGTIAGNLRMAAPDASDDVLAAALRDASASFVLDLPGGTGHRLGDGGRQLSGGERQRLALARALLRNPDLLILDEATSALDGDNEHAIAGAIARLRGSVTILVIGHRGALAALADRQVRIENGQIVS